MSSIYIAINWQTERFILPKACNAKPPKAVEMPKRGKKLEMPNPQKLLKCQTVEKSL
uniref:Uncharacterized protein n=1 Tax=Meloidogyne enterolobii TaxID=390850 RepID=A0A6V7XZD6_MELEN|nr:unnamed protein product [Meloidogyne enterolobii]